MIKDVVKSKIIFYSFLQQKIKIQMKGNKGRFESKICKQYRDDLTTKYILLFIYFINSYTTGHIS